MAVNPAWASCLEKPKKKHIESNKPIAITTMVNVTRLSRGQNPREADAPQPDRPEVIAQVNDDRSEWSEETEEEERQEQARQKDEGEEEEEEESTDEAEEEEASLVSVESSEFFEDVVSSSNEKGLHDIRIGKNYKSVQAERNEICKLQNLCAKPLNRDDC